VDNLKIGGKQKGDKYVMIYQNAQLKPIWQRLKACLGGLDQRNARRFKTLLDRLNRLDQRSAAGVKRLAYYASWFNRAVVRGGSKGIVKKRTGSRLGDAFSAVFYRAVSLLDKLDTALWFSGRIYQAKACRVRSQSEKKIANWLTDQEIKFVYEKPLKLGKVTLHPDFYLVESDVYLEYWGLAGANQQYTATMQAKLRLYQEHGVKVISLYPKHLKDKRGLDAVLPDLLAEAKRK